MGSVPLPGSSHFNPRPPCGRRHERTHRERRERKFQPTSPVRETTTWLFFSADVAAISTHVPRAGDDQEVRITVLAMYLFQPTSPVRETTHSRGQYSALAQISTHVPRAGDDGQRHDLPSWGQHFNPRPPCGRRRAWRHGERVEIAFQPTSPVRETTSGDTDAMRKELISTHVPRAGDDRCNLLPRFNPVNISTHVPRAGDDLSFFGDFNLPLHFNPRPPCGRRLAGLVLAHRRTNISTHVPRAGDDFFAYLAFITSPHFNPRPPCGRRPEAGMCLCWNNSISTHVPRAGDDRKFGR